MVLNICELSNNVPTTRNIQYYTNIVANHALKRRLIQPDIANDGYDNELELDAILVMPSDVF